MGQRLCPSPRLLATFSLGNGAQIYRADFFDVPTDFWLNMYWLLLCGTLIYLLGYGIRALLVLRKDERSRRIANVYLLASISGFIACLIRISTAFVTPLQHIEGGSLVWLFACLCGAGFAWRRRIPGGKRSNGLSGRRFACSC